jgi:hypothetical protein
MATITASVFASILIFVIPFGCSEFLSEPEVGYEYEFAEIKIVDSKKMFVSRRGNSNLKCNERVNKESASN